ncbi:gamma-secretase subunit Aph-1-like [Dermacentor silvarum]|uniref:gamma-secretase subunit Aph-1-like n=1 Tax=Dermacentor silvarum TaxID=543639 RepID=UPI001898D766|nr:gamma-secretase subunit Aph-1-like [Dermacentor silvarum]
MGLLECVGYSLIAFGPSLAIFWVIIVGQPSRLVVFLVSSFFWLLSLLLSSIAWFMLNEFFDAPFAVCLFTSVGFQEFFRYLAFRTLRKAEEALNVVNLVGSEFDVALVRYHTTFACVSGLGFGATSAASAMLNVLADVGAGPGTVGFFGDHKSLDCIIYSATAACFALLQTLWSVVAFHALLFRRYCVLLFVPAAHLFTSGVTILTGQAHQDVQYEAIPLAAAGVVLYMTAAVAFVVSGGTQRNLFSCLGGLLRNTGGSINAPEAPERQQL